jgi:hypothetical protein
MAKNIEVTCKPSNKKFIASVESVDEFKTSVLSGAQLNGLGKFLVTIDGNNIPDPSVLTQEMLDSAEIVELTPYAKYALGWVS